MTGCKLYCDFPFRKVKVLDNGDVVQCCHQATKAFGNLFEHDFDQIWFGPTAEAVRQAVIAQEIHPVCSRRGVCPHIYKPLEPKLAELESEYPSFLEFDLPNTHCNIGGSTPKPNTACVMCPRSSKDFVPHPDRSLELAAKLRFLMPNLRNLMLSGLSEPFWKGKLFEMLEVLNFAAQQHKCVVHLFSNGAVFDRNTREEFIKACPRARVTFSLDAVTGVTYKRIRRLETFEEILDNIRCFSQEKRASQDLMIANNINLLNLDEAVSMVDLAKDLGASVVHFNPTHDCGTGRTDLDPILIGPDNFERFDLIETQIRHRAREISMTVNFHRPLALKYKSQKNALSLVQSS